MSRPLLIGGRKFDFRLFVAVTSFRPLRAWLHREGFARFAAARYDADLTSLANPFAHLTNHAVAKGAPGFDAAACDLKWPLAAFRAWLTTSRGEAAAASCMADIAALLAAALRAVAPRVIADRRCAELYGCDVMLDADLRPWLLEVNASPSLSADTETDYELKTCVVCDFFTLTDVEGAFGAAGPPASVGGFDALCAPGLGEAALPPPALGGWTDRRAALAQAQAARAAMDAGVRLQGR